MPRPGSGGSSGGLRARQRESTRNALLDGAVATFRDRGYARATVEEIADAAGASRATFYLHFPTKSALLPELLERARSVFTADYRALGPLFAAPDRDGLHRWVVTAMGKWGEVGDLMRPVYEGAGADPDLSRTLFGDGLPGLEEMVAVVRNAEGMRTPEEVDAYGAVLYAPLAQSFQRYLRGDPFDHAVVARVIADVWFTVLGVARGR